MNGVSMTRTLVPITMAECRDVEEEVILGFHLYTLVAIQSCIGLSPPFWS